MRRASTLGAALTAGVFLGACATAGETEHHSEGEGGAAGAGEPGSIAEELEELDPVDYHKDGTVVVGDRRFESVQAFHRSPEFREGNRRCASQHPPMQAFDPSDCSFTFTSIQPEYQPDAVYEIPVVFHIVQRADGTGYIPEDLVRSQLEVLNEDFQALPNSAGEPGVNAAIRFVFAEEDPDGNPTDGINYYTNDDWYRDPGPGRASDMKRTIAWDPDRYFNIYTNDSAGALGYATFPTQSAGTLDDGIVLLHTSVGKDAPDGGDFDQGRTGTHEVGHYLGLFHTFQGGCGDANSPYTSGDLIADTAAHSGPNFECNPQPSSCPGESGDLPIHNYMNYTPDACMHEFSPEQANRMRCSLIHYRPELYTIVEDDGAAAPEAGFEASATDLTVSFTDTSAYDAGSISSWEWRFGDGATSDERDPIHTYAEPGSYTVRLAITADDGATDRHTKTVSVTETPATSGELESGEPITGLSGAAGDAHHFFIDVPEGASRVKFEMSAGPDSSGDADLYVRLGAEPTTTSWECRPFLSGSDEACTHDEPEAGRWHVMVRGYTAFEDVDLVATIAAGDEDDGSFAVEHAELRGTEGSMDRFAVDVPDGAENLVIEIGGGTGDADLYVRRGAEPTLDEWDHRPYRFGNDESVSIASPEADRYHMMLHGYDDYEGVTLRIRYDR